MRRIFGHSFPKVFSGRITHPPVSIRAQSASNPKSTCELTPKKYLAFLLEQFSTWMNQKLEAGTPAQDFSKSPFAKALILAGHDQNFLTPKSCEKKWREAETIARTSAMQLGGATDQDSILQETRCLLQDRMRENLEAYVLPVATGVSRKDFAILEAFANAIPNGAAKIIGLAQGIAGNLESGHPESLTLERQAFAFAPLARFVRIITVDVAAGILQQRGEAEFTKMVSFLSTQEDLGLLFRMVENFSNRNQLFQILFYGEAKEFEVNGEFFSLVLKFKPVALREDANPAEIREALRERAKGMEITAEAGCNGVPEVAAAFGQGAYARLEAFLRFLKRVLNQAH